MVTVNVHKLIKLVFINIFNNYKLPYIVSRSTI